VRIPVFARRSNPSVDLPIIRKSVAYCEKQVADLLAEWVNPSDHSQGIIAREFLPRETMPDFSPAPLETLPASELPGVKFEDPENSEAKREERARLVEAARMVTYFGSDKELIPAGI
jgi:hypothetical protein